MVGSTHGSTPEGAPATVRAIQRPRRRRGISSILLRVAVCAAAGCRGFVFYECAERTDSEAGSVRYVYSQPRYPSNPHSTALEVHKPAHAHVIIGSSRTHGVALRPRPGTRAPRVRSCSSWAWGCPCVCSRAAGPCRSHAGTGTAGGGSPIAPTASGVMYALGVQVGRRGGGLAALSTE